MSLIELPAGKTGTSVDQSEPRASARLFSFPLARRVAPSSNPESSNLDLRTRTRTRGPRVPTFRNAGSGSEARSTCPLFHPCKKIPNPSPARNHRTSRMRPDPRRSSAVSRRTTPTRAPPGFPRPRRQALGERRARRINPSGGEPPLLQGETLNFQRPKSEHDLQAGFAQRHRAHRDRKGSTSVCSVPLCETVFGIGRWDSMRVHHKARRHKEIPGVIVFVPSRLCGENSGLSSKWRSRSGWAGRPPRPWEL